MSQYLKDALRPTPQSEPLDERQVRNEAGGFVYETDPQQRLRRFLILGSEGGTYYADQRKITEENVDNLRRLIKSAGPETVETIVDVSERGLAPKNDPALLALAIASVDGDDRTRAAAFAALPKVARIGTHLFTWVDFRDALGGWGRGARDAVGSWYERDAESLAYQLVKYRQRGGWTHRDVLRVAHPKAASVEHKALFDFACGREFTGEDRMIQGYIAATKAETPRQSADLILQYGLPREAINTDHLNDPDVWDALLLSMPVTATIRNLGKMSAVGLLAPGSEAERIVRDRVTNPEALRKGRVHPIALLSALLTYGSGSGVRGSLSWHPAPKVVDALDEGFYQAFGAVEPTGKRTLLALDVSGSMTFGTIAGVPGLSPNVGAAAMALVTANVEERYDVMAFADTFRELVISPRQRLDDVVRLTGSLSFGGTDCALPMLWAAQNNRAFDAFVIYTDSETWAGRVHPMEALRAYRTQTGIDAKLAVVGMTSNGFSIADPDDGLDVVGFDTSAPNLISSYVRGDL